VDILAQRNSCADNSTQVENCPEYTNEYTLLTFGRVGQHKRALSGPQEASTDAENGTSDYNKGSILLADVNRTKAEMDERGVKRRIAAAHRKELIYRA